MPVDDHERPGHLNGEFHFGSFGQKGGGGDGQSLLVHVEAFANKFFNANPFDGDRQFNRYAFKLPTFL